MALQALSMMNGTFLREKAIALANRLIKEASGETDRIQLAYELVLGRPANGTDQAEMLEYLKGYQSQLQSEGHSSEEAQLLAWTSLAKKVWKYDKQVW